MEARRYVLGVSCLQNDARLREQIHKLSGVSGLKHERLLGCLNVEPGNTWQARSPLNAFAECGTGYVAYPNAQLYLRRTHYGGGCGLVAEGAICKEKAASDPDPPDVPGRGVQYRDLTVIEVDT